MDAWHRIRDRRPSPAWQYGYPKCIARADDVVELVGRHIVAQVVAAIVGEPELARARLPVEADTVAHASRHHLATAAVDVHPQDEAMHGVGLADIAGRADVGVELAVGAERDVPPAVVHFAGKIADDGDAGRRRIQMRLDSVETHDSVDRRRVQRAVTECDADRRLEPAADARDTCVGQRHAVPRPSHRVYAGSVAADEERALLAPCHRPRTVHTRDDVDDKARRHMQAVERQVALGERERRHQSPGDEREDHSSHCSIVPR